MEEYKEFTGTSIEEAKEMAKDYFNTNEIEFELLPPKFLSMFSGKKSFRINAKRAELDNDFYDFEKNATAKLTEIIKAMGFNSEITTKIENKAIELNITDESFDEVRGRGTELADALQYMVLKSLHGASKERINVSVDINSCKHDREDFIKSLAERACASVQKTGKEYILKPLNPRERRLVHIYVGANGFESESIGDSRFKKIRIFKASKAEQKSE